MMSSKADDGRDLIRIVPALARTKIKLMIRRPFKGARAHDFDAFVHVFKI